MKQLAALLQGRPPQSVDESAVMTEEEKPLATDYDGPWKKEKAMKHVSYAEQKGMEKGELLGQVRLCQELLKQNPTPKEDLLAMKQEEREALLARLREQLPPNGDQ
jgi:hypothetical protein